MTPKRKGSRAKFRVGQVVAIRGYMKSDPRALGFVKSVSGDGLSVVLYIEISGNMDTLTYTIGELRPLTAREKGKP